MPKENCKICIYDDGFSVIGSPEALAHIRNLCLHYGWLRHLYPSKYIPNRVYVDTDSIRILYTVIKYLKDNKINTNIL